MTGEFVMWRFPGVAAPGSVSSQPASMGRMTIWLWHDAGRVDTPGRSRRPSRGGSHCVVRPLGFEPRTCGLRVRCSAIELEARETATYGSSQGDTGVAHASRRTAGWPTGFEPATSGITTRRSDQLSYGHQGASSVAHAEGGPDTVRHRPTPLYLNWIEQVVSTHQVAGSTPAGGTVCSVAAPAGDRHAPGPPASTRRVRATRTVPRKRRPPPA